MMSFISSLFKDATGNIKRKHILAFRNYWTFKKIINLVLCEIEKKKIKVITHAMPYTMTIDVTNICNLHCPGCPTGLGLMGRQKGMLDLKQLQKMLDEVGDYLFIAHLYNWGEPLLHPDISEIVRMIHKNGIFTSISSNFNINNLNCLSEICDAGLDHLIISADGATDSTYKMYRHGGNFELLLNNIRHIVAYKKSTGRNRPILEWQILDFRHTESEIKDAYIIANELGIDWFTVRGAIAPKHRQPEIKMLDGNYYSEKKTCDLLWHNITMQNNGGIAPCCFIYHEQDDFGHIDSSSIRQIRINDRYKYARKIFDSRDEIVIDQSDSHPCLRCPIVHRQNHLKQKIAVSPNAFTDDSFMFIVADKTELEVIQKKY